MMKKFFGFKSRNKHKRQTCSEHVANERALSDSTSSVSASRDQHGDGSLAVQYPNDYSSDRNSGTWADREYCVAPIDQDACNDMTPRSLHSSVKRPNAKRRRSSQPSIASSNDRMSRHSSRGSRGFSRDPDTAFRQLLTLCESSSDNDTIFEILDQLRPDGPGKSDRRPIDGELEEWEQRLSQCFWIVAATDNTMLMKRLIELSPYFDQYRGAEMGETVLHQAARHGQISIVDLLIKAGASVNARDIDHNTADVIAAGHGHHSCAAVICQAQNKPLYPIPQYPYNGYHNGGYNNGGYNNDKYPGPPGFNVIHEAPVQQIYEAPTNPVYYEMEQPTQHVFYDSSNVAPSQPYSPTSMPGDSPTEWNNHNPKRPW